MLINVLNLESFFLMRLASLKVAHKQQFPIDSLKSDSGLQSVSSQVHLGIQS